MPASKALPGRGATPPQNLCHLDVRSDPHGLILVVWPWALMCVCLNFVSFKWGQQYLSNKVAVRSKLDHRRGAMPTWMDKLDLTRALKVKSMEALLYASYTFTPSEWCPGTKVTVITPPCLLGSQGERSDVAVYKYISLSLSPSTKFLPGLSSLCLALSPIGHTHTL